MIKCSFHKLELKYSYHPTGGCMSQVYEGVRWTITDLELLPDNGNHYEIN
ncbi:hypothetical protein [Aphanizomenon sp. CS-733/32]|nr:hypothetical protein [Aphanizomenon sp. CS-733/32]